MQPVSYLTPPPVNSRAPEPTVALLRFAWDTVMARLGFFVVLSAIAIVAGLFSLGIHLGAAYLLGINFLRPKGTIDELLTLQALSVAVGALIVAPVTAGYLGVVFKVLRHEPDEMKGFSAASRFFIPAASAHLALGAATIAINVLCRLAFGKLWSGFASIPFELFVSFAVMLVIPAIVGLEMSVLQAISYSLKRVMSRPFAYFGYYIACQFLAGLGAFACGLGLVLTLSVGPVALALLITGIVPVSMEGDPGAYPRYREQQGY